MAYPNGKLCVSFKKYGETILYDRNGLPSIAFIPSVLGPFFVVYSQKLRNFDGKIKGGPLALFNLNGHGVVYDEDGKKRLIYDQAQGIYYDSPVKIPIKWRWKSYEKIIWRREETKYVKPDELLDIDHEEKMKIRSRRELNMRSRKNRKWSSPATESMTRKSKYSRAKTPTLLPKVRIKTSTVKSSIDLEKDHSFLRQIFGDRKLNLMRSLIPTKLKFTRSKCAFEPLLETCEEALRSAVSPEKVGSTFDISSSYLMKREKSSRLKKKLEERKALIKCIPNTQLTPLSFGMNFSEIKPIVLKINDTVSLTIMSQDHIHLDFFSHPFHFSFSIGIIVNTSELKNLYSVKNIHEVKEPIPCFFEAMQDKSVDLKDLCLQLKQIRDEAKNLAQLKNDTGIKRNTAPYEDTQILIK